MPQNSVDSDTLTAVFNKGLFNEVNIQNFTSYTLDADFFVPADAFSLSIEDDRADELNNKIVIGSPLVISINDAPQLIGYVEKVDYHYVRGAGSQLHISGRDTLGLMSDAITPPNNTFTNTTTIKQILTSLFADFGITTGKYSISDIAEMSVATAGLVGSANRGKTPKAVAKSWLRQINRQIKPRKEEGYLEYAMRICKEVGLNIKLLPGTTKAYVNTPIYDRTSPPLFALNNRFSTNGSGSPKQNNIKSGNLSFDYTRQPSVIISEMSGAQQPSFEINQQKVLMVNDLIGYNAFGDLYDELQAIVDKYSKTYGYYLIPPSQGLSDAVPNLLVNQPDVIGTIARPMYLFDEHATNQDELIFFTLEKMSKHQDAFMHLEYEVKDHSFNKYIWQVNQMVSVSDDRLEMYSNYWIKRRTFSKSRDHGTTTRLVLSLPYIWNFFATDDAVTNA